MKFFISIIVTALFSFALCLFLPWWSIAIAAALVALLIHQHAGKAFLSGFIALFLLWGGLALFLSSGSGEGLSHKISMLVLQKDNPVLLVGATALIGALVAGLAAVSGSLMRKVRVVE